MKEIESILTGFLDSPVYLLSLHLDSSDVMESTFLADGHFCSGIFSDDRLFIERIDSATAEIEGYAEGIADELGIRLDSDSMFESLMGYLRLDMKCSPGNKPCGKTCIPQQKECRLRGGAKGQLNSAKRKMRSPGLGGVAGAALATGAVGAGAYVSGKNKGRIKEGVDNAKARLGEGREELRENVRGKVQSALDKDEKRHRKKEKMKHREQFKELNIADKALYSSGLASMADIDPAKYKKLNLPNKILANWGGNPDGKTIAEKAGFKKSKRRR